MPRSITITETECESMVLGLDHLLRLMEATRFVSPHAKPLAKPKPAKPPAKPVELPAVMTPDTRLDAKQAAKLLGITYGTFRQEATKIKPAGFGRYRVADLERYAKTRRPKPKKKNKGTKAIVQTQDSE